MKKRIVVVILLLLAAGAGIAYWRYFRSPNRTNGLVASGHIEVTEVDLSFRLSGHIGRLLVEEGDQVKKGDLVAELRSEILEARRDQAAGLVRELEARQASSALAIQIKEDVVQAELNQAQANVSAAKARYQTLQSGSRTEEIQEAAAAVESARSEAENRRREYERIKNLYDRKMVSASQYEDAQTAAEAAQAAFKAADERYKLVKLGPRHEAVMEGRANLNQSAAALKAVEAGQKEIDRLKLDLKALEAQVAQAEAALAIAEDDLAQACLYAPFDGFVTVKDVEADEFVQAGTPVLTLAQLNRVWVKTYIPETQLGRIRLGQPAEIASDSFPHKRYPGIVTFISPEAEFTPKNVQTKEERIKLVYRFKVTLENPRQELKAGMPVDVYLR